VLCRCRFLTWCVMTNGVWHTGYRIKIELTHADLGHPDRPDLLDEITVPIEQRDRELLQCLQHHATGVCRAEEEDRSPWMTIRRRTVDGVTTLVAAHLPVRSRPTAEESDKHKALKERITRWVRVDDWSWREIASPRAMLVRGGVRHLQDWACTPSAQRPCPVNGSSCGGLHVQWDLPVLCLPPRPHTLVDDLVAASAEGQYVPLKIPGQHNPRSSTRLWAPEADRHRWRDIIGEDEALPDAEPVPQAGLTFTEQALNSTCRYGEDTRVFDDLRPRRDHADASGLHTFPEVPQRIFRIPRQPQLLTASTEHRAAAARRYGCPTWHIGPCAGCGTPIHRYGPGSVHACDNCRRRATGPPLEQPPGQPAARVVKAAPFASR
jgi:hypothetical protein